MLTAHDFAHDALMACNPNCDRDIWLQLAMAAHAAGVSFEAFDAWSAQADSYNAADCRAVWRSINPGAVTAGTLFWHARQAGWKPPQGAALQSVHRTPAAAHKPHYAPAVAQHVPLGAEDLARWRALVPACEADIARRYLQARGCVIPPGDGDLKFHTALRHWPTGFIGPALVALVTDARTCEPLTLHYTWIQVDGSKAAVDRPRLLLPGHRKAGGVIRLWPDVDVTMGLGIAEGFETALALAHGMQPAWACIDAGNMASFPVLNGIDALLIAADNDPAGIRAANACAERWASAGREVRIAKAPNAGQDLADVARAAA
jgi:putative DNA primase/helicase